MSEDVLTLWLDAVIEQSKQIVKLIELDDTSRAFVHEHPAIEQGYQVMQSNAVAAHSFAVTLRQMVELIRTETPT